MSVCTGKRERESERLKWKETMQKKIFFFFKFFFFKTTGKKEGERHGLKKDRGERD